MPYCIPTRSSDKPLPPPESVATELRREMLKLLFKWERNCESIFLSTCATGQLSSFLRYLRAPLKQGVGTTGLKIASRVLEELEQEEIQRCRNSQIADTVIRRRVLEAKAAFHGTDEIIYLHSPISS